MNSSDRQLISAFKMIGEMCERIHLAKSIKVSLFDLRLPGEYKLSVQDQADLLYTKVLESKQLKGKNSEAVAAACLYIACRKEGVPRTFKGMLSFVMPECNAVLPTLDCLQRFALCLASERRKSAVVSN